MVKPASDRTLDLAAMRPTMASEGVRMRKLVILADGELESTPEGARFRIAGWPESYVIKGKVPPPGSARIRAVVHIKGGKPVLHVD